MQVVDAGIEGRCAVGPQIIRDQSIRNDGVFPQKLAQQFQRGVLVALGLDQHIQNLALGVDGAPRLRHRLGIDEREDGARQANVDLYGLRRWFIAKARDAINAGGQGFTMYTVAEVVGHQKGDLGLSMTSHYADRETMAAKAACVRAVKLPAPAALLKQIRDA